MKELIFVTFLFQGTHWIAAGIVAGFIGALIGWMITRRRNPRFIQIMTPAFCGGLAGALFGKGLNAVWTYQQSLSTCTKLQFLCEMEANWNALHIGTLGTTIGAMFGGGLMTMIWLVGIKHARRF